MFAARRAGVGVHKAAAAAAYRYYRIYITATEGGGQVQLVEMELRATLGGSDLTSPATSVTTSSNLIPSYGGDKLVDNVTVGENLWMSSGTPSVGAPQWARFDLGTAQTVLQLAIYPAGGDVGVVTNAPKDFIVQGSSDGTTFTDVKTFTGITGWTIAWRTFNL